MVQLESLDTIPQKFLRSDVSKDRPALHNIDGTLTRGQFLNLVKETALGFITIGISTCEHIAILLPNSPDWIVADLATSAAGAVSVPIYSSLSTEETAAILNDSEVSTIIYSLDQSEKVSALKSKVPTLRRLITTEPSKNKTDESIDLTALRMLGVEKGDIIVLTERLDGLHPDDPFSIIYTSGTTGRPKGVVLTHKNILSNINAVLLRVNIEEEDLYLSYLPLSHIFERMVHHLLVQVGAGIAYSEGFAFVGKDAALFKPTVMAGVPFFFDRVKEKVEESVSKAGPIKKRLFAAAIKKGAQNGAKAGPKGGGLGRLLDSIVLKKIRDKAGPRIRFFISGGAPLSKETADFFWAVGLPVIEGYGLTETSPVISANTLDETKTGTVGKAIPGVTIKIAEDGEILVKGPGIMAGYHNMPKANERAFRDGWFHTGDVGFLDKEGYLTITDRKKDIIITTVAKNISPQAIETALRTDPLIKEALVYGNGRAHLVALIVPEPEKLKERCANLKRTDGDSYIHTDPAIRREFEEVIRNRLKKFARFEQIRRFALIEDSITQESGEVTPTMKVRRALVGERFEKLIDKLYSAEGLG